MLFINRLEAQNTGGNLRQKSIQLTKDTLFLDTLPLVYGSVEVFVNRTQKIADYRIDHSRSVMVFDSSIIGKSITVHYRVLFFKSQQTFYRKPLYLIEPTFNGTPRYLYDYGSGENRGFSLFGEDLKASGVISRGVGFGNNQDVVLNSNMNFQLNGKLGKGFSILAAISDENNPIQPEGNTQQIQDFDNVFISVFKDSNYLRVGDFLMNTPSSSYFMKYYKKSRGLQVDYSNKGKIKHHLHADAAVSRGKFVRNEIQGVEGNQGPYRLQGANGELNIIVISATEVVYVDGEKLERGQQNDYVIDYNVGEIYFMPRKLITKFSRIVVEFQYSDRNYTRSVFTFSDEIRTGKFISSVRYFTEQDNKLQPTDTSNSSSIQEILGNAGDTRAFFNYEKKYDAYQFDRVNYRKIDSLGYEIFIFTNNPDSDTAFYTTVFSLVGQNKGNYIQIASSANGRVYAWVEPVNGVPQGLYEPYVELVAPKRMQMLSAGTTYSPDKNLEVKAEAAYTNDNVNTYSVLDKKNDDGLGLFFSLAQREFKYRKLSINNSVKAEYISSGFKFVERYRAVEFNRIWNRQLNNSVLNVRTNEIVTGLQSEFNIGDFNKVIIELSNYRRGNVFNGLRAAGTYRYLGAAWSANLHGEQMNTELKSDVKINNTIQSYRGELQYTAKSYKIGTNAIFEESRFSVDTSANLNATSFRYSQIGAFMQSMFNEVWTYRLEADFRTDDDVEQKGFKYASSGLNVKGNLERVGKSFNRLNVVGSFRKLNLSIGEDEEVMLGRVEYNAGFLKRAFISSTYYQIGTGREQKRTFSFALVQSGNGTHTWVDYNKDGIEQINEFEPAVYADQAKYVKIWLPSNEFIKSNTNEFNQTFRIQAPTLWQGASPFKRFVARFNSITSYKADRRITDNSILTIINPLKLDVADSTLIAVNSLIKQTTFFNRSNARFGIEHTIQSTKGKQYLNSGFEWRRFDKNQLVTRVGIGKRVSLILDVQRADKQTLNDFFENRNYKYRSEIVFPELFYQTSKGLRFGTYYKYTEARNDPAFGDISAFINEYGVELRYFIINRGNIDARLSSHQISYNGDPNTPLAFDLLSGLSNGQNLTWKVGFGGKAKNGIQFNLSYEGRKTPVFKAVHIGRAEARYIF